MFPVGLSILPVQPNQLSSIRVDQVHDLLTINAVQFREEFEGIPTPRLQISLFQVVAEISVRLRLELFYLLVGHTDVRYDHVAKERL